ncbi:MAG: oligosaccharide flippase family protein [Acutalibacteraceae bacterium]
MRKKRFILNAAVLTGTSLAARTMGIFFRVYMSSIIGAQGIGLYQLISSVYMLAATFSTSGISLVVTRLVTEGIAKKNESRQRSVVLACLCMGVLLSLCACAALYLNADFIGGEILGDERTVLSIKILAPGLPFMAVSACFRGYFYAKRTAIKTASEQLIEQIAEIAVFALVVGIMAPMGLEYACAAIAVGTTCAEAVTCLYSFIMYKLEISGIRGRQRLNKGFLKKAAVIGVPVTLSSCLRTGLITAENVLIPQGLKKYGASAEKSLGDYGLITGMAMPVLAFPSAFLLSFSQLMIPEMSEAAAAVRKNSIHYMTARILRFAFLFSLPTAVIFFFFSDNISVMLYGDSSAGMYMRVLSPTVPLIYMDAVVDGMLKGLNQQLHYLAYNIIDSVLRVALILFLLPHFGIRALVATMFLSSLINCTFSLSRLLKVTELRFEPIGWILKPLAASVLPCIVLDIALKCKILPQNVFTTVFVLTAAVVLYIIIMTVTGAIKKEELSWIKETVSLK